MSRKMSKRDFLKEFGYTERAKHIKDATQLEIESKRYAREHDIEIKGWGNNYQTNSLKGSVDYTEKLLGKDEELGQLYGDIFSRNDPDFDGFDRKKNRKKKTGSDNGRTRSNRNGGNSWEDEDYFPGMISFYKEKIKGNRRRGGHGSLKDLLCSPLGVVLAVLAVCIFLYKVVGPAMYSFIMNGPFFKILCILLAGAAVVAILKSARGWPSGVKFTVILVIALVLLYQLVGPAIYAFLMSGALFRIICLVIAVAASIGILKGNIGWPIGVKLVVIVVIWMVLKSEVL